MQLSISCIIVASRMQDTVEAILQQLDSRISIHDFRMLRRELYTQLRFDAALPARWMPRREEVQQHLEKELAALGQGEFRAAVTYDLDPFEQT